MTRIYTTIHIPATIETVFDYVTTPGNWPQWHPSSLGVHGATDHSLEVEEQVTEDFRVAKRRGKALWTVRERTFPRRWVIEGVIEQSGGSGGIITYTFSPQRDGTFFEREFVYKMPTPLFALLDIVIIRHRIMAESKQALRQLKAVLCQQDAREDRTSSMQELEKN
jgi:uncharacterized protein YndB with AHSA1/START domain